VQSYLADLDLSGLREPPPENLRLFSKLGLTDSEFRPKAALSAWDALFTRKLR
jgi:hypothetical protein